MRSLSQQEGFIWNKEVLFTTQERRQSGMEDQDEDMGEEMVPQEIVFPEQDLVFDL